MMLKNSLTPIFFLLIYINTLFGNLEDKCWTSFEILYWKAKENSFVLTNRPVSVFFHDDFTTSRVFLPSFEWDVGYRIALDFLPDCQNWQMEVNLTHYNTKINEEHTARKLEGFFPIWSFADDIIAGDYVTRASLNGKLSLDIVDWNYIGSFPCKYQIKLNPYYGLRAAWVRQHAGIDYEGGIFLIGIIDRGNSILGTDQIHLKNNFSGVGPRIGLKPTVSLTPTISLFCNAAISYLYGIYNLRHKEEYLDETRFFYHKKLKKWRGITDFAAGASWKTSLLDEKYILYVNFGWEYHTFYHQWQLKKDDFDLIPQHKNLVLQGATLSLDIGY